MFDRKEGKKESELTSKAERFISVRKENLCKIMRSNKQIKQIGWWHVERFRKILGKLRFRDKI